MENKIGSFIMKNPYAISEMLIVMMLIVPLPVILIEVLLGVEVILAIAILSFSMIKKTEILTILMKCFVVFSLPVNTSFLRDSLINHNPENQISLVRAIYSIRISNIETAGMLKIIDCQIIWFIVPIIFVVLYGIIIRSNFLSSKIADLCPYVKISLKLIIFETIVMTLLSIGYFALYTVECVHVNNQTINQAIDSFLLLWPCIAGILYFPLILVVFSPGVFIGLNSNNKKC